MRYYLVELYLSSRRSDGLPEAVAQAREAAEQMAREGVDVRYLRSIFIPEDETCFCLYEAASREVVAEASRRTGLPYVRIVEAALVAPDEARDISSTGDR